MTLDIDTDAAAAGLGNSPTPRVPRRYAHDWDLFTDWCQASEHRSLPAHPTVVAEFLADHPAATGTQRRRVTAINAVHTANGLSEPGRAETIRQLLSDHRAERIDRVRSVVWQRIPQIPITGWPGGLFGRRDALILTLVAGGIGYKDIARLRRTDLTAENEVLVIQVGEKWIHIQDGESPVSAATVCRRWEEVLGFLDRHPSTNLLGQRLDSHDADLSSFAHALRQDERPMFTPIDRWGHTPFIPVALSAQSVAVLVRAHLAGQAPVHKQLIPRPSAVRRSVASIPIANVELDTGYYDRGTTARRDAHTQLEDVADILDSIEDEADALLAELLVLLHETTTSGPD